MLKFEVHDEQELEDWLVAPSPAVFQNVDLTAYAERMMHHDLTGCAFLGCLLPEELTRLAGVAKCMVLPRVEPTPERPFDPYSVELYSPGQLYAGFDPDDPQTFEQYLDRRIYVSYIDPQTKLMRPVAADTMLLRRMHDATVSEALDDIISGKEQRIVAIMGGHDRSRAEAIYKDVAHLALQLTRNGYLIATGGGPGLMEAANLGAYVAGFVNAEDLLDEAIAQLARAPVFSDSNWLAVGFTTWKKMGSPSDSNASMNLGIPTWFYGHEPPNMFATHIAKYFENSVREEGMLAIAQGGVIFSEGNAGTVQEIFQDACQNYYRTLNRVKSPMILLGKDYWNPRAMSMTDSKDKRKQVYSLLQKLGYEKGFLDYILLTDSIDEVVSFIAAHPPAP